ncbi:MAG: hypothetical protein JWQ17_631 [Tardiphaga sp.]|nr:hypothetical protein [Tardiphaga sp.]
MDAIDRRHALRGMMCVALAAGFGATLLPNTVEAMPLVPQKDLVSKDLGSKVDVPGEKPQPIASRPPRRPMARPRRPIHHHRRPRRVCWLHRGRRVCRWRY